MVTVMEINSTSFIPYLSKTVNRRTSISLEDIIPSEGLGISNISNPVPGTSSIASVPPNPS